MLNGVALGIFVNRLAGVCDEMGAVLRNAAFSPNIKERLDYSCAIFDSNGQLLAQAAHIPVHLGSMAYAMRSISTQVDWQPGDVVVVNDPYLGGTHLPDITLISPVFVGANLVAFVANRAHHADIGCVSPGSMPIASNLYDEGIVLAPQKLLVGGELQHELINGLMSKMLNREESYGDFVAQIAANDTGVDKVLALILNQGEPRFISGCEQIQLYGRSLALEAVARIPNGVYQFEDELDSDGFGAAHINITLKMTVSDSRVTVDFSGTHQQVSGNINCPLSVTAAGVYYVFRCLLPDNTPACHGAFSLIDLIVPDGCLLNARRPAAVAAGNVETSTRVADVVLGALSQALPDEIPAASQGTMNNVAMGSKDDKWAYYETIGGGAGAGPSSDGLSAVQSHMTNTLNTPVEIVEQRFPLRVSRYAIRENSGGAGEHAGGNGIERNYQFLRPTQVTLLTERRRTKPWGLSQGMPGEAGENILNGMFLADKIEFNAVRGDELSILTPGGGGWGRQG